MTSLFCSPGLGISIGGYSNRSDIYYTRGGSNKDLMSEEAIPKPNGFLVCFLTGQNIITAIHIRINQKSRILFVKISQAVTEREKGAMRRHGAVVSA